MLQVFRDARFAVAAEAFADRLYEPDGTLRTRKLSDALIRDPAQAAQQALSIAVSSEVTASDGSQVPVQAETICIHGDTPGASKIAASVALTLGNAGVQLAPLFRSGSW